MVLTYSTMMKLETVAPDFNLPDVASDKKYSLADFKDKKAFLVMFICSHCPYVKHVEKEVAKLGNEYLEKDVGVVAISANDPDYDSDDRPEGLKKQAESVGFKFPYLLDEAQEVLACVAAEPCAAFFHQGQEADIIVFGPRPEGLASAAKFF